MSARPAVLWAAILVMVAVTFAYRLSFIQLFGRVDEIPPRIERALRFVPAAVLAALVLPAVVYVDGSLALSAGNERLFAAVLAAAVAWYTESMLLTIGVGMAALWLLRFVL